HAAVPDRHELGHTGLRLRLQDRDRVAVGRELEARVARARALGAGGPAPRGALGGGGVRNRRSGLLLVDSDHGISFRGPQLTPAPVPAPEPEAPPARG